MGLSTRQALLRGFFFTLARQFLLRRPPYTLLADDFNFGQKKVLENKTVRNFYASEILSVRNFKRPKCLQYSIRLLSTFLGDAITCIQGQFT